MKTYKMQDLENLLLKKYESLGVRRLQNGTLLIGEAKYVAPFAYIHSQFAPLTEEEITEMEENLHIKLPSNLEAFYRSYNGLNLFHASLSIYGLRKETGRDINAAYQPFHIYTPNLEERMEDATEDMLFLGSYQLDGSKVYIDLSDLTISFCSEESTKPIKKWKGFEEWISEETNRLIKLHDKEGKNIPFSSTLPIGGEDVVSSLKRMAKKMKKPPYWFLESE